MKHKKRAQTIFPFKVFFGVNVLFVMLHLYQYVLFVRLSYQKQQTEKHLALLQERHTHRMQEIEEMKTRALVRHYAAKELGMKILSLRQVRRIPSTQELS